MFYLYYLSIFFCGCILGWKISGMYEVFRGDKYGFIGSVVFRCVLEDKVYNFRGRRSFEIYFYSLVWGSEVFGGGWKFKFYIKDIKFIFSLYFY